MEEKNVFLKEEQGLEGSVGNVPIGISEKFKICPKCKVILFAFHNGNWNVCPRCHQGYRIDQVEFSENGFFTSIEIHRPILSYFQ